MSSAAWLAYLAAISALIISPGPSALLVVRTASSLGLVAAVRAILGGSLSALILICVSLAGLARLAGDDLLGLLRLCGGLYLLYAGISQWRQASPLQTQSAAAPGQRIFLSAFLVGMSNPKDILFFSSFLSLLVPQNGSLLLHGQVVLVWVLVDLLIMLGYAWFAQHQRLLDGRQLSRCCAVLLSTFGCAALLLETQPLYAQLSAL